MMLELAARAADQVAEQLRPICKRLEVAGSIRRRASEVRDLEIVCIPDVQRYADFQRLVASWPKIRGEPTGRYTRRKLVRHDVELDLFICSADTWACNLLIRTGCKEFSQSLMVLAQEKGLRFQDAQLWRGSARVHVREEEDVFRELGVPWLAPDRRTVEAGRRVLDREYDRARRARAEEDWLLR